MSVVHRRLAGAAAAAPPVVTVSLFTTQVPASTDVDNGASISVGTLMRTAVAGHAYGIRWYSALTIDLAATVELWSPTAAAAGTLLASAASPTPTAGAWNDQPFASPVALAAHDLFVPTVNLPGGHIVVTGAFFGAALTNGDLSGLADLDDPVGFGAMRDGCFASPAAGPGGLYPGSGFNANCFFVDVLFAAS